MLTLGAQKHRGAVEVPQVGFDIMPTYQAAGDVMCSVQ